jgi:hypothetical protein
MTRDLRQPSEVARPETWQSAPGDELIGTVVRYERVDTRNGEKIVAHIRPDDGSPVVAIWLGTVLMSEFKRLRPRPGERVGVKRHEDGRSKAGHVYQVWSVIVDRPDEQQEKAPW